VIVKFACPRRSDQASSVILGNGMGISAVVGEGRKEATEGLLLREGVGACESTLGCGGACWVVSRGGMASIVGD